jgi:hypothetical protein
MNAKEAKDFLVQQTTEQAALENVTLSEGEKRMMYFAENDPLSCPNPLQVNDEFEAEYNSGEYEAKIGRLLRHCHKRLQTENPEKARNWDEAIQALRQGDHYFLVLWRVKPTGEHRLRDLLLMVAIGLVIVAGIIAAAIWSNK